ncbi:A/G-specific adenine glycosylase [Marinicella sp. S1101]|uniref:A/G-specific adenine glycosylase n=1 Tax=Marinicella marina TaxID=2996016 RepID=UPI002260BB80|nr:A/G-specific adenine glycosylase [Marinicella marina]MCX7553029.1 A/G-specific adenine glycosylase [Marinicella marina]MDJ1139661.1 A/G-specific adenine glycosylase [Marinicella marina]
MPSSTDLNRPQKSISFSQRVVQWHHQHGRKNLPWQQTTGAEKPYHVWLSEIMLQQTQVIKVIEYFDRFISAFPTLNDLAAADEQQVLALWSGLGYYNRARNLHKAARICVDQHQATLPRDLDQLIALPGIGRSTAAAIMSLAYNQPEPIMDGNVKRVFARYFLVDGEPNKSSTLKQLWQLAEAHREIDEPAAYTQGLMDLGATLCSKTKPRCDVCPITESCLAKAKGVIADYPQKKRKVKQVEVDLFVVLSVDQQHVALELRNEHSIWPSLWFPPVFADKDSLLATHPNAKKHFSLTHKLTHRILQIHVFNVAQVVNHPEIKWVNIEKLEQYPHPKALNHILNQHDNH